MKAMKILLLLFTCYASNSWAGFSMVKPQPPLQNPHPPTSVEDRRRVDFAVAQIRAKYGAPIEIRHPHVIPWSFENFQKNRKKAASPLDSSPNPPPPPQDLKSMNPPVLKADEFMVHTYARHHYPQYPQGGDWNHLDVILSEDNAGKLTLRGFYEIPMPYDSQLPPGVDC